MATRHGSTSTTKSWSGPRWCLVIHITLTIGILLGSHHEELTDRPAANYASFAASVGGEAITVAMGGLRWYG